MTVANKIAKILLVEDNLDDITITQRALKEAYALFLVKVVLTVHMPIE